MGEIAFQGNIPNHNQWCDTWEEYFSRNLHSIMAIERSIHGADPEMDALSSKIMTKVVPRLLRPLETGGNKIKPVLLHGDMWHGNVSVDNETDEPILYDAGSFFGHNEYDLSPWRATRYRFNRTHVRAYHKLVPVSEPAEDHDDRNALYAL
jgi:protein-ribulosamine 3-kinase